MQQRLIDGTTLLRKFTHSPTGERFFTRDCDNFPIQVNLEAVQQEIRKAPTVDAVPVVRCKDCKFSIYDGEFCIHSCTRPLGTVGSAIMRPDDFCSYGEQRNTDMKL